MKSFNLQLSKKNKFKNGFSLVEILVVVFIMAVAFTSFYTVSAIGTQFIIEVKNRLGAVALANEKMEIARNLEYDSVGIQGGIPDGNIPEDEDVTENGRSFHVHTIVQYVDDPLDGVYPADPIPNDYKVLKIVVSWKDVKGQIQTVDLISRFVPVGLETTNGGAPLAINVKDSSGNPIAQTSVHIVNSAVSPVVNFTVNTDNDGHIMIPAAPESNGKYQISISKNGYETVSSVDPSAVSYVPNYANPSVLLNVLNMYDYIEDQLSNLTIKVLDYQNNPVPNISFAITGGKVIGRDASNANVYSLSQTDTADLNGEKAYNNISPGNYTITMNPNAQYSFVEFDPAMSPFALVPGTTSTYTMRVADKTQNALALTVTDSVSNSPIAGALVTLTDSTGVDVFSAKQTSANGIVFYPDSSNVLLSGTYTLKVEAAGYATQTTSVTIDKLTTKQIILIAN